jgi:hypothetical protein
VNSEVTMSGKRANIANGILWAAAIIASALVGAPTILSAALLPALAAASILVMGLRERRKPA